MWRWLWEEERSGEDGRCVEEWDGYRAAPLPLPFSPSLQSSAPEVGRDSSVAELGVNFIPAPMTRDKNGTNSRWPVGARTRECVVPGIVSQLCGFGAPFPSEPVGFTIRDRAV